MFVCYNSGNIWQQQLYDAVDSAKCFVAMLTDSYFQSTVCQEEFNIATARHIADVSVLEMKYTRQWYERRTLI